MPKLPSKEGLKEVRKKLKEEHKQHPSDVLISIIEEVTEQKDKKDIEKPDIAAKGAEVNL